MPCICVVEHARETANRARHTRYRGVLSVCLSVCLSVSPCLDRCGSDWTSRTPWISRRRGQTDTKANIGTCLLAPSNCRCLTFILPPRLTSRRPFHSFLFLLLFIIRAYTKHNQCSFLLLSLLPCPSPALSSDPSSHTHARTHECAHTNYADSKKAYGAKERAEGHVCRYRTKVLGHQNNPRQMARALMHLRESTERPANMQGHRKEILEVYIAY